MIEHIDVPCPGTLTLLQKNVLPEAFGVADPDSTLPCDGTKDLQLKVAASAGAVLGSLVFGYLGDIKGRKKMYGFELVIIVVATLGQAVAAGGQSINVISVLTMWRFVMGFGVGGDYPSSAVIASEYFESVYRGRILSSVFAFQGLGTLTAAIVTLICLAAFGDSDASLDKIWRVVLGFICIVGVLAVVFRFKIPEPPRYIFFVERHPRPVGEFLDRYQVNPGPETVNDILRQARGQSWPDFVEVLCREWKQLACLSYAWFVVDFSFYGLGLNSSVIIAKTNLFGTRSTDSFAGRLKGICYGNLTLLAGAIPGHLACIAFIDRIGRRYLQAVGFIAVAFLFLIMGFLSYLPDRDGSDDDASPQNDKVPWVAFFAIYCISNFFQNFGANSTTFILPAEHFPTRYRSTAYGIAAASGKLGSVITQILLFIYAVVSATGLIPTKFLEETKQRSLESLTADEINMDILRHPQDHQPVDRVPNDVAMNANREVNGDGRPPQPSLELRTRY
ncbi:hypothetical protein V5O48_013764 [Marasmius crinis-equi]|uniref:Major facilitator superfamily (MFS) profile domain-containing protein n=1 Tax=Marasmius crinis-equi TaxID=585013 RepID=A0ABR3EZ61_9AGAR